MEESLITFVCVLLSGRHIGLPLHCAFVFLSVEEFFALYMERGAPRRGEEIEAIAFLYSLRNLRVNFSSLYKRDSYYLLFKLLLLGTPSRLRRTPSIITEGEPVGLLAVEEYFFLLLVYPGRHIGLPLHCAFVFCLFVLLSKNSFL